MGWFWAESNPRPTIVVAPHPVPENSASPPPACPMHETSPTGQLPFPPRQIASEPAPSSCPVKSPSNASRYPPQNSLQDSKPQGLMAKLNPLNYMPNLENRKLDESLQTGNLPLEKETSSIPRGDSEANWEYPSPQQMYNAMLRKGYTDTPVDAVEAMVAVHNFLNEGAWAEIVDWENIFAQGLAKGWEKCREGEEGLARQKAIQAYMQARAEALGTPVPREAEQMQPKLLRFQGRPGDPTPKSRILQTLGMIMPDTFGSEPPFDRHDWFVARKQADGSVREVRYVIDYYGGGLQATGEPVFYLDIRPALDSPTAAAERLIRWGGDVWWKASGGSVRKESVGKS